MGAAQSCAEQMARWLDGGVAAHAQNCPPRVLDGSHAAAVSACQGLLCVMCDQIPLQNPVDTVRHEVWILVPCYQKLLAETMSYPNAG